MKKTYLGEFEEVILLTVALLNDQAYGVAITEALEEQTARSASMTRITHPQHGQPICSNGSVLLTCWKK